MKIFVPILALLLIVFGKPVTGSAQVSIQKIIQIESSGNPKAFNKHSKARGLMQITPICLKHYNYRHDTNIKEEDLFDPKINITVGSWYLYWLGLCFDTDDKVLVGYNWGYRYALEWNGDVNKLPKETRNYLKKYKEL